ncbi:hypothetical protein CP532_5636 [Ophiocordyceps camponoti-leonardi (nom. inval.)]|nr:hypothetical protein CP532_5636 [Ophiocordyceps camponoti-leonardi (nom. inval.)]
MSTPAAAPPVPDSPGTWRHPRLDEINRRRNASNFSEKNVRRIAYNLVALLALWAIRRVARLKLDPRILPTNLAYYLSWAWIALQLVPIAQIGLACLPLVRNEDDVSDIPLTATQRKLLGLPPPSTPPTPDGHFSTPPRYSRTPSIAGSVGSRASYNSSPLSGRGSPALQASTGASPSPFSSVGSPLLHKTVGSIAHGQRSSIGSTSPLGASSSINLFSDPGSPSPSSGKRTSVGLNNKWLYEKGRRTSGSAWPS